MLALYEIKLVGLRQLSFFLKGVLSNIVFVYSLFRYTVYDLTAERQYLVTVHVGLCLEAYSPCRFETTVLKKALLPKKVCKLYSGFANTSKKTKVMESFIMISGYWEIKLNIVIRLWFWQVYAILKNKSLK